MDFNIGNIIKTLRLQRGLTQRELADNICSIKQLSRIEANTSIPTALLLKEFSYRLGEDLSVYFLYLDQHNPFEAKTFIDLLDKLLLKSNYLEVYALTYPLIAVYKTKKTFYHKQVLWFYGYSTLHIDEVDSESIEFFLNILRSNDNTSISLDNLFQSFLKPFDYNVISAIILIHLQNGHLETAKLLMIHAIDSYEKYYPDFKDLCYLKFIYNLGRLFLLERNYEKVIYWTDKGIHYCTSQNVISYLDDFCNLKGRSLYELGHISEGKTYLRQFVVLAGMYSEHVDKSDVIQNIIKIYDI